MSPPVLLVLGASGKTGSRVLHQALKRGWQCSAFVRNVERLAPSLRPQLSEVYIGDLNDSMSVSRAIKSAKPDVIVDASSALPFGLAKGSPANNADRGQLLDVVIAALVESERLDVTKFIIVGGQLIPEPGGTINTIFARVLEFLLRYIIAPVQWKAVDRAIERLWSSPSSFQFTMMRMGEMLEKPSLGKLHPEQTTGGNYPRTSVSYDDVAEGILDLAEDKSKLWSRKACYMNYVQ